MQKKEWKGWQKLLLSETMAGKNDSHRIAYIAVFTAFLRGVEYVFRVQAGGNAIFAHLIPVRFDGDYHWADFRVRGLFLGGLGGLFVPFRRVCVYAVDRDFPWYDRGDCRLGCQRVAQRKGVVFIYKTGACLLAQPNHLYHTHQHDGVLAALFQGQLRQIFGVALVRAGANLELPCQLRVAVYQRARFG